MMKRTIISCLAVLLMMVGAKADNLTVEAVEIEPGATTTVGISLTNTENNLVSFQMDLTLPEGISLNKANCVLTSRITDVDQELVIGKQGEHVYRLTSASFNLTPIAGTNGELITLSITAANTFAGGLATISNIVFANRNSETINIPSTNFNISVPTPASPNIVFADANVKAICVANWDTNHDGELSEAEAAAVTDLGTVFRENSTITSFNELQYFIGLTSIGDHAFENCSSLVGVTIPSSTKTIGDCSFRYCSRLTSIHIPSSVVDIDSQAFNYCPSLETITVALENSVFDSRNNCNAIIETSYNSLRVGCKNTVIPLSVLNIMTYAFTGCSNLVNISIPNSINDIGGSAFMDCSGLLSITIPSGVTDIGMLAFYGCTSLRNIDLPNTITGLEVGAFEHCTSLESLTIPNGLTYLADLSFDGCTSLSTVVIPNSVTEIGQRAFWGCNNLTSVTVNWELPLEIWDGVFSNRTNATLYVPYGTKAAYEAADYWKDFKEIIEMSVPSPNIAFADANVKAICVANWDTNGDGELSEAEAAAVTDLGEVFRHNTTITSFDELQYFTGLTSIAGGAFFGCSSLTSVMIPENVTILADDAFYCCSGLTSMTMPNSVEGIGSAAFWGCTSMTSLTISNSVTDIVDFVFYGCSALTSLEIPSSVTRIGHGAFAGCSNLSSVTIPNVTSYGDDVFWNSNSLTSVTVGNPTPVDISENVFESRWNATLYVPAGSKEAYQAADYWKEFKNIVVDGSTVQPGDSNGDGEIDVLDATAIMYYFLGRNPDITPAWADVNGDGDVDILDATIIMYMAMGIY